MSQSSSDNESSRSIYDRYQRCSFLDVVQHVDVYGSFRACYNEPRSRSWKNVSGKCSGALLSPARSIFDVEPKVSGFSIRKKVSDMLPGVELWSRVRKTSETSVITNAFVPKSRASRAEIGASDGCE